MPSYGYIDGKRIRGYCQDCGTPVFGIMNIRCGDCHLAKKSFDSLEKIY